ncbi:MAG: hypothetical protein ACFFER_02825, partial [Candidatus Thorarchaeota archaeon]
METFEVAQFFIALATVVAAGAIINYSWKRSSQADAETKRAFRPLYLFALAMLIYAVGTFITFQEAATGRSFLVDFLADYFEINLWFLEGLLFPYYSLFVILVVEIVILAVAASMITRQRLFGLIVLLVAVASVIILAQSIDLQFQHRVSGRADFLFSLGSL